jgi:hypothetical protein
VSEGIGLDLTQIEARSQNARCGEMIAATFNNKRVMSDINDKIGIYQ